MHYHPERDKNVRLKEYVQSRQALGGEATIGLIYEGDILPEEIFNNLWRTVYGFERQFSRFIPMSELSVFNRLAGAKQPVSSEFRALLTSAKELGIKTGGLFNPFILPALQRAGYKNSAALGYENDEQEDHTKKHVTTVDKLEIGDDWASIPYGTALDMGGCGKGYLIDLLSKSLDEKKVNGYWISLGGDIAVSGHDENGNNIIVSIQDANKLRGVTDWTFTSTGGYCGIATSGTFKRAGQSQTNWHHIIDPITLKPALTDVRLATVCATTAVEADVLASCAVILGSNKAANFLSCYGATSMLLQCQDKNGKTFTRQFGPLIVKNDALEAARTEQYA